MIQAEQLRGFGIRVLSEAINGNEAFKYIRQNPDQKINIIILDLDMPIMNGYQACQYILKFLKEREFRKRVDKRRCSIVERIIQDAEN